MTDKVISVKAEDLGNISLEDLISLNKETKTKSKIDYEEWIDSLDCEAKYKNLLKAFIDITGKIANQVINFGKIVLDFIEKAIDRFPCTAMGLFIGALLSILVANIPGLGLLLGPLFAPVLVAVPTAIGFLKDIGFDFALLDITKILSNIGNLSRNNYEKEMH